MLHGTIVATMTSPVFHMLGRAPAPVAPFSHAVEIDGWVFVTGQLPIEPRNEAAPVPEGIENQTRKVFDNLLIVLNGVGLELSHVISARVFLTHFERDYEEMNAVYATYFAPDRRPARTCIGVTALARGSLVEIDLIARRPT
jgi:2-iminobutanoate/2-iminopropanoate deaminase